ncbi:MAG: hypothetical protein GX448_12620 [Planctomycetes bacterium]|nr:hypothetical protein [Planctomycetota bacterium]
MLARLHSVILEGIEGVICEVEVDVVIAAANGMIVPLENAREAAWSRRSRSMESVRCRMRSSSSRAG